LESPFISYVLIIAVQTEIGLRFQRSHMTYLSPTDCDRLMRLTLRRKQIACHTRDSCVLVVIVKDPLDSVDSLMVQSHLSVPPCCAVSVSPTGDLRPAGVVYRPHKFLSFFTEQAF